MKGTVVLVFGVAVITHGYLILTLIGHRVDPGVLMRTCSIVVDYAGNVSISRRLGLVL